MLRGGGQQALQHRPPRPPGPSQHTGGSPSSPGTIWHLPKQSRDKSQNNLQRINGNADLTRPSRGTGQCPTQTPRPPQNASTPALPNSELPWLSRRPAGSPPGSHSRLQYSSHLETRVPASEHLPVQVIQDHGQMPPCSPLVTEVGTLQCQHPCGCQLTSQPAAC